MLQAGGLIELHYHRNLEDVLEFFEDKDDTLYYKYKPLFNNLTISEYKDNGLSKKSDGLYVDFSFLNRFKYDYETNELYFDDIIVSREYTDNQIQDVVNEIWNTNPYHEIGKLDLLYWLVEIESDTNHIIYENQLDEDIKIILNNPDSHVLTIEENNIQYVSIDTVSYITVQAGKRLSITSPNSTLNINITSQ